MLNDFFLPISMVMGLIVFGFAARWYVAPALSRLDRKAALTPFLLLHATRYVGLAFLIPGVTAEPLDPRFADFAAYGDLVAAVVALVALLALRLDWPIAITPYAANVTKLSPCIACSMRGVSACGALESKELDRLAAITTPIVVDERMSEGNRHVK